MASQKRIIRYVAYIRVSSNNQDVENSLTAQEAAARRYVEQRGGILVRIYMDEAKSGRVADRPGFLEMIEDGTSETRDFDVILVWKLNRFARNRKTSVTYKAKLAEHGVKVVSINEQISDGPSGQLVEGILETIDEFHSANMSSDIKNGMKNSVERGFFLGSSAPIGYKIYHVRDGAKFRPKLELDPPWDKIARRAFDLALADVSVQETARTLNDEGFRTRDGKRFNKTKVHRMIKNEHYTGYTVWNNSADPEEHARSFEQAHPAIISPEDFETVQRKLAEKAPNVVHPRTVAADHLFNDLGYCTVCNGKVAIRSGKGGDYHYFICLNREKHGKSHCDLPRYSSDKNDPILLEAILGDVLTDENLRTAIDSVRSKSASANVSAKSKLDDIDKRLLALDQRETNLLIAFETGRTPIEKYTMRTDVVQAEIEELKIQRELVQSQLGTEAAILEDPETITAYAKDLNTYLQKASVNSANAMMKRFIKVIWFEPGYATIEYEIPVPDGTPIGRNTKRIALRSPVRRTVTAGPPY